MVVRQIGAPPELESAHGKDEKIEKAIETSTVFSLIFQRFPPLFLIEEMLTPERSPGHHNHHTQRA
jgi:hypothetical protein